MTINPAIEKSNHQAVREFIHSNPLHAGSIIERLFNDDLSAKNAILYDWSLWARPEQVFDIPDDKTTVLLLAGRGWGKTTWLANTIVTEALKEPNQRIMLMAADYNNLKRINFLGKSGIINCINPDIEYQFNKADLTIEFDNGTVLFSYSAEAYDKTRGSEASKVFLDELAAWQYPDEGLEAARLVNRLGVKPMLFIATTPRPKDIIRKLVKDDKVLLLKGKTTDNYFLPSSYHDELRRTLSDRMYRQECLAEILDDNPFALFKRSDIDKQRISAGKLAEIKTKLTQVCVAIDPSGGKGEGHDDVGIVVCGRDADEQGYVLEDATFNATPREWAERAVQLYHQWQCNVIVVEQNFGGEMVKHTLETVDRNVRIELTNASRAKDIRAEPVAALYEHGKIHHVGSFSKLEDECCQYDPNDKKQASPNRMDAMVWGFKHLLIKSKANYYCVTL